MSLNNEQLPVDLKKPQISFTSSAVKPTTENLFLGQHLHYEHNTDVLENTVNIEFMPPQLNFAIEPNSVNNTSDEHQHSFDFNALMQKIDEEVQQYYENVKDPFVIKNANGPVMHIGIDSEFYEVMELIRGKETYRNVVLSCQAYTRVGNKSYEYIFYPKGKKYTDRITFKKFISNVINKIIKEDKSLTLPSMVYVYGHFLRADLPSFKSFWKMKDELSGIGGTVASVMKPYKVDINDERKRKFSPEPICLSDYNRHTYKCFVKFIDTMLHTPNRAGLAVAGEMIGLPKLPIPEGHDISRMDKLLEQDKSAFYKYAMRDARVACDFGISRHDFTRNELGLGNLPPTIGACAVSAFKNTLKQQIKRTPSLGSFESIFGIYNEKQEYWHVKNQRTQTRPVKRTASHRENHKGFVTLCYHGARNEGVYCGPTPVGTYYDLDLKGAYTTGLCDLFTFDYSKITPSTDVGDYLGHVAGYAHVEFEFPKNTRFPCLPVSAGDKGLIFPLKGESYCTAAEIMAAHNLGCSIKMVYGIIVPWAQTEIRLFEPIVRKVREERNKAKAVGDKSKDETWKEIGNSLYGKFAQGLKEKTAFDTKLGKNVKISESSVTNEFIAAYVTGYIRAVIAELLNQIPPNEIVVSMTTDGWLGSYPLEKFDFDTPLVKRYQHLSNLIDGSCMLEEKSRSTQVIGARTRGQFSSKLDGEHPPILAKAGIRPDVKIEFEDDRNAIKVKQNEAMVNLYLNRRFDDKPMKFSTLIPQGEMWLLESDLVRKNQKRRANLEYDFKRKPINHHMMNVRDTEHLAFDSKPWDSIDDFLKVRAIFDGFRRRGNLKTMNDWYEWDDYYQTKLVVKKGCGMNINEKGSVDVLRRIFFRAYTRETWGLTRDHTNSEIAEWLTNNGYPTNPDDLKNAKRAKLVAQTVPATLKAVQLLKVILKKYPSLSMEMLFPIADLDRVTEMLIEH
ncbi:hypothetical protein NBRC116592_04120 [Colwellia sp. KU-HH00111]|uniref:DNA polymerase n=1 Tax=Colwellia sp. KU-HH00111 TaxID=3127652 RepID=UPI00310A47CD